MSNKPMIVSVSTQLPTPILTANEIMQRVQEMLNPTIDGIFDTNRVQQKMLEDFIQLKRDVWGSSDG